jgi:hypothetical protein
MTTRGVGVDDLAAACAVDRKTVERWLSTDRVPHRRHRWAAVRHLKTDEAELSPSVARRHADRMPAQAELVALYPERASVPRDVWLRLLTHAREHVDLLVFSGTFYQQSQPRIAAQLAARAKAGAKVRLCFGTPDGEAVATRDVEEGCTAPSVRRSARR